MSLLKIKGVRVAVGGKEMIHGVDLMVDTGETVVLSGRNGAGKSTLARAVAGLASDKIVDGEIDFDSVNILTLSKNELMQRGVFLTWQQPVEIPGVTVKDLIWEMWQMQGRRRVELDKQIVEYCKLLGMDIFTATREVNVGMSGGERKKLELLQMMCARPKLAILDEVDSGLDREAARKVTQALAEYQAKNGTAYLIITHNRWVLESLRVDREYCLNGGYLSVVECTCKRTGGAKCVV